MRRSYIQSLACTIVAIFALANAVRAEEADVFTGKDVFHRVMKKAAAENWKALPIGELMGKIAMEFEGTSYQANSLELSPDKEKCSVHLEGLDCVTFFETTLGMARMIKKGKSTPEDLMSEVSFTRYRGGKPGDYISRLHYTSDWLLDNQNKRVVKILDQLPGELTFTQKVGFMSKHPDKYRQLDAHADLVPKIKRVEDTINKRTMKFVPMYQIATVEPLLRTGDIVGVCTTTEGIDITHTGLVIRTEDGVAHFMDASSKKGKVTLEPDHLGKAINWSRSLTGAMFARPLEP